MLTNLGNAVLVYNQKNLSSNSKNDRAFIVEATKDVWELVNHEKLWFKHNGYIFIPFEYKGCRVFSSLNNSLLGAKNIDSKTIKFYSDNFEIDTRMAADIRRSEYEDLLPSPEAATLMTYENVFATSISPRTKWTKVENVNRIVHITTPQGHGKLVYSIDNKDYLTIETMGQYLDESLKTLIISDVTGKYIEPTRKSLENAIDFAKQIAASVDRRDLVSRFGDDFRRHDYNRAFEVAENIAKRMKSGESIWNAREECSDIYEKAWNVQLQEHFDEFAENMKYSFSQVIHGTRKFSITFAKTPQDECGIILSRYQSGSIKLDSTQQKTLAELLYLNSKIQTKVNKYQLDSKNNEIMNQKNEMKRMQAKLNELKKTLCKDLRDIPILKTRIQETNVKIQTQLREGLNTFGINDVGEFVKQVTIVEADPIPPQSLDDDIPF